MVSGAVDFSKDPKRTNLFIVSAPPSLTSCCAARHAHTERDLDRNLQNDRVRLARSLCACQPTKFET